MRLKEIAERLRCSVQEEVDIEISGVATIEDAVAGEITFLANPKYIPKVSQCRASAIIAGEELDREKSPCTILRSSNPYLAFARCLEMFYEAPRAPVGIHPTAVIDPSAEVASSASVGAFTFIGANVKVGEGVALHPHCVIYADARIGAGSEIHSGTAIRERSIVGERVIIHNNCVIGADGFGFAKQDDGSHYKIPQSGRVVIEDDVEIGAGTTIDRAALGETRVRRGTKIDDQVMIGHGCVVGEQTILCAQVGLSGTTRVGRNVILAGQVGAGGHLTIGDGAMAIAQAGIPGDVAAGAVIAGSPAVSREEWLRSSAVYRRLPDLQKSVRKLEKEVAELAERLRSRRDA